MDIKKAREIAQDVIIKNQNKDNPLSNFDLLAETIQIYESRLSFKKKRIPELGQKVIDWIIKNEDLIFSLDHADKNSSIIKIIKRNKCLPETEGEYMRKRNPPMQS